MQVITLPEGSHDLRSARFYMLVIRSGTAGLVGAVHFRQDQLQIDLFVFFSVFLAGFFLFVSVCVIIWQVGLDFKISVTGSGEFCVHKVVASLLHTRE